MFKNHSINTEMKRLTPLILVIYVLESVAALTPLAEAADLSGVFFRPEGESTALFDGPGNQQRLVKVGAMISATERLLEVQPFAVVIETPNGRKTIRLKQETSSGYSTPTVASTAIRTRQLPPARPGSREEVAQKNKRALLIGLTPVFKSGKALGYAVQSLDSLEFFSAAGVRKDDIVLKIDGTRFNDPEDLDDLSWEMNRRRSYTITVNRNGTEQTFAVER